MNKIYVYLLLILVLGGAAWFLINKNKTNQIGEKRKLFTIENTDIVTKVFLANKAGVSILLEKQTDGNWMVNKKYEVRKGQIELLLETFKRMEVRNTAAKPAQTKIVNEMATMGLKVEIYAGEKNLKTYYVGGNTIDDLGTYMMLEGETQPYITIIPGFNGYLSARYFTREADWRNREIFILDPKEIESIQVNYPSETANSFFINFASMAKPVLSNMKGDTTTQLDKKFVMEFIGQFQNIQYESVSQVSAVQKDSILKSKPFASIILVEKAGKRREVYLYPITLSVDSNLGYGNDGKRLYQSETRMLTYSKDFPTLVVSQLFSFRKALVTHADFMPGAKRKPSLN